MAIVNDRTKVALALMAVRAVRSKAGELQGLPATVSFEQLRSSIDQMNLAYLPAKALTDAYTLAQIQTAAERNFIAVPANVRTLILAVGTALGQFNTAYASLYAGAGNVMSFSATTGLHTFISVSVSALSSLATPVANIITACSALDYED